MKIAISLFIVLMFSACVEAPTYGELENADFGNPVETAECIAVAQIFIANQLYDPGAAIFRNITCKEKEWLPSLGIMGIPITYGYLFRGHVNGKNLYGAYIGFAEFRGIVRNDGDGAKVVRYCLDSTSDPLEVCSPTLVK